MDFGMFMEFQTRAGGDESSAFAEGFALAAAAESWGLDAAWLSEFHFSPDRSVLSSPITVASAIAARTERMRIGMAVYVLPLNNPLRIAEEVATVDRISNGRLDLGVGRSGFTYFYEAYGIPYAESQGRFEETMEILHKAWLGEPFSYQGKYFQIKEAAVFPRPLQQPHPPLRVAASRAETFARIGDQGLPIFIGLRGSGTAEQASNLASYREAWRRAGHAGTGSVYLRVPLYAGASEKAAIEAARDTLVFYFERQSKLVAADAARRAAASNDAGGDETRRQTAATLAELSYEDILTSRVAVGSPQGLVDRLLQLREELGLDGIVAEMNAGGRLSEQQVLASLRILTHDVMPHFK
jgi:alkanesulfonate monooxygenase SsuD/methylene tetrahydromethanopterin reductase-like flavin-dependent oxidoreductase (luciferase family)